MYYYQLMQYGKFAQIYDALMRDVDYGAWAERIAPLITAGGSVLECACGTGEISFRLAKMGYNVIASDISEDMLRIAAQKQRELGLASARLRFVSMDMRHIALHKRVDAVIACCDGVNYLTSREDLKSFFSSANAVLKPGGRLIFDVSSRYKLENVLGSNCFIDNGRETAYMWQNEYDPASKLIRMELSFFVRTDGSRYERFDEEHIQRAHSVREIGSRLDEAGFDHEVFGGYTENPACDTDERLLFTAVKRQ